MSILRRVPDSVLWLLKPSTTKAAIAIKKKLIAEAAMFGIHHSRLLWAERVPKRAHLGRHRHVGLFLDTLIYNAHSTATDSLRAGKGRR